MCQAPSPPLCFFYMTDSYSLLRWQMLFYRKETQPQKVLITDLRSCSSKVAELSDREKERGGGEVTLRSDHGR